LTRFRSRVVAFQKCVGSLPFPILVHANKASRGREEKFKHNEQTTAIRTVVTFNTGSSAALRGTAHQLFHLALGGLWSCKGVVALALTPDMHRIY